MRTLERTQADAILPVSFSRSDDGPQIPIQTAERRKTAALMPFQAHRGFDAIPPR